MSKKRPFAKMMLEQDSTYTWVVACNNLGEAKLFNYIINTCDRNSLDWEYSKYKQTAITQLIGISRSTTHTYLKHMLIPNEKAGKPALLKKIGRSAYRINDYYIDFK